MVIAPPQVAPRTSTFAIIAFVSAFVVPVVGIVLGVLALRETTRTGEGGRGLARAGLIVGVVATVFQLGFFIVWLSFFATIVAEHGFAGS